MRMRLVLILIPLLAFSAFGQSVGGAEIPRMAMLPLEAEGVSENDASIATQSLTTELIRQGRFDVLEREYMAQIMEEQAMVLTCTDVECAIEIGKVLAAENVMVGSITHSEGNYIISVRLIDVEEGRVIASTTERSHASGTALGELARDIGQRTYPNTIVEREDSGWLWWTLGGIAAAGIGTGVVLMLSGEEGDGGTIDGLPGWPDLPDY